MSFGSRLFLMEKNEFDWIFQWLFHSLPWNYQAARACMIPLLFKCTRGIETLHVIKYDDIGDDCDEHEWREKIPAGNNLNGFIFHSSLTRRESVKRTQLNNANTTVENKKKYIKYQHEGERERETGREGKVAMSSHWSNSIFIFISIASKVTRVLTFADRLQFDQNFSVIC